MDTASVHRPLKKFLLSRNDRLVLFCVSILTILVDRLNYFLFLTLRVGSIDQVKNVEQIVQRDDANSRDAAKMIDLSSESFTRSFVRNNGITLWFQVRFVVVVVCNIVCHPITI